MIVSQPDRILLNRELALFASELCGDILDVGGGSGKRYRHLFSHATRLRSLDINADLQPDIVGDAEKMPIDNDSVDGIICTQVLEHVPHPWKVIPELFRVLRPGGKMLLTVPQLNELHEEPHDYYRYTKFGLTVLCEEAGFRILQLHQRGRYRTVMAQNRIRRWIDGWNPYQRRLPMLILAPISYVYARYALWRDSFDTSAASAKHAIGWTMILQKPE